MSNRNKQKQIWADEMFVAKLEQIKAKRTLVGKPVNNMGDLTRLLSETEGFKNIEEELLNFDPLVGRSSKKKVNKINIKFDGLI